MGSKFVSIEKVREALANYIYSEGCGCCALYDEHKEHKEVLGKLLNVPKYSDSSGYDFSKFRSRK